ncbi:DUF4192 domain-containing protein [Streptomyces arenae]|uniref:DUF4192 domain-containing protein n=1 Tax=Streptomyces arenae TaxID=29301 RepID=UPI0026591F5B|nr:DUF4192 domain-containing protein [Streptomyces arenae]MCG7206272.1 DUF4192 domain-containing protein [Streptomyces arenae]
MTNHSETTEPSENSEAEDGPTPLCGSAHDPQVTLRTPAELADALPYLLGYRPEDSMVLMALHDRGGRGCFGGRARLGIPANKDDWESAARQLAQGLMAGSERRGARPEQMVAYVCQEPAPGESGRDVMRRLAPLAQLLRTECGRLDVPVIEALCISDARFWSYCCPAEACCPAEGTPMGLPGTSVLAAAATYAGIQVRGSLRELRARLLPWETGAAPEQEIALDRAGMALVPRILDDAFRAQVAEDTLALARRIIERYADATPVPGIHQADLRDDRLLAHDEAAQLILGLQDRLTRDRAAAWMEDAEAGPALRLWRALARRCVGPYSEHAAAPLTLAGWVAWSSGDELEGREALAMALGADPDYLFAALLHRACNEGLDPESIRRCLRTARTERVLEDRSAADAAGTGDRAETEDTADTKDAGPSPLAPDTGHPPTAGTGAPPARRPHGADNPDNPDYTVNRDSTNNTDNRPRRPDATRPRRQEGTRTRRRGTDTTRPGSTRPDGPRTRTRTRTRTAESTDGNSVEKADVRGARTGPEEARSGNSRGERDE